MRPNAYWSNTLLSVDRGDGVRSCVHHVTFPDYSDLLNLVEIVN
jgi:hypothetical protein